MVFTNTAVASDIGRPPSDVVIEWIRDPAELGSIAAEWAELEASVGGRTHLSSVDFIVPWYQQYAGSYGGVPLIGPARRGTRLVGVAPLTICRGSMGRIPVTRVEFAPSDTPAGEFLVEDEHPETVAAFIDGLLEATTFDLISLDGFAPGGAQIKAVEHAAAKHHMSVETVDHAYAIADLSGVYAAYRARLSGHFRRNLNQKARKIADAGGAAIGGIQFSADAGEMERCVARIITINEASYKLNGQRLADNHRAFFSDVVRRLGARGTLSLSILSIGGQDAAFIMGVLRSTAVRVIRFSLEPVWRRLRHLEEAQVS